MDGEVSVGDLGIVRLSRIMVSEMAKCKGTFTHTERGKERGGRIDR